MTQEKGIRASNIRNGFSRRIDEEQQPVAGPSGAATPSDATVPWSPAAGGVASLGQSVADDSEGFSTPGVSVPGTPAHEASDFSLALQTSIEYEVSGEASTSRTGKKALSAAAKKKRKKADSDSDEDDLAPLKGPPKGRYADRKPGSFAMCAECNKKVCIASYCALA